MSKLKSRILIPGVVSLCVLVSGAFFISHILNQPANGSVSIGTSPTTHASTTSIATRVSTPFYTVLLPQGYTVRQQIDTPNGSQVISRVIATGGVDRHIQLAITVGILPNDGLAGIGDYNLRVTQHESYAASHFEGEPQGSEGFRTLSGPSSICVFSQHGAQYYQVALTSDAPESEPLLQDAYAHLSSTWRNL